MQTLRLWTWQLPDWDITCQRRDLSKLAEAWGEDTAQQLRPLYDRLHREIKTEDFIFCFTCYEHWAQLEVRRLWVLDVPRGGILRYKDSLMWEALRNRDFSTVSEKEAWKSLFLDEGEALRRIVAEEGTSVVPLVAVPIPGVWGVDNTRFNMGPAVPPSRTSYERLPTSESEARRYRQ